MAGWNIADVLEVVADEVPDSLAVAQGERRLTWREFDARAQALATGLVEHGLRRDDKVVQYLRNSPEYLESFVAALKASMVPVNTNYRYGPAELTYLWQDCDARAVVFAASFTDTVAQVRPAVPEVRWWLWVDDSSGGSCPDWATAYDDVAREPHPLISPPERDGDDLVLLYTGGTTGLPKGVMWRQDDLMILLGNATGGRYPDVADLDYARSRVARDGRRHIPAAPLMHGAGCLTCLPVLARGGAAVLLESPSFRAEELLDAVARERAYSVSWVGDAFAKPVVDALDDNPGRWDLSSWSVLSSGGVLFSDDSKRRLLDHVPGLVIADVYGSSEALNAARSVSRAGDDAAPARTFAVGESVAVLGDDDAPVVPGSGVVGKVAYTGRLPLGYYNDETKSAATFRVIGGRRYSFTGDFAMVESDGRINLLGRGSSCINTGGEKVYPEEVEEVLKRHRSVADAAVLGVPDERFGEKIVAAVVASPGSSIDEAVLRDHVRGLLAGYKVPRVVLTLPDLARGPNGKADMDRVREVVLRQVAHA